MSKTYCLLLYCNMGTPKYWKTSSRMLESLFCRIECIFFITDLHANTEKLISQPSFIEFSTFRTKKDMHYTRYLALATQNAHYICSRQANPRIEEVASYSMMKLQTETHITPVPRLKKITFKSVTKQSQDLCI